MLAGLSDTPPAHHTKGGEMKLNQRESSVLGSQLLYVSISTPNGEIYLGMTANFPDGWYGIGAGDELDGVEVGPFTNKNDAAWSLVRSALSA